MNVVVMGAWNRNLQEDNKLVNEILDDLKRRYPGVLRIVTAGCDRGIGKLVKNRCMPQEKGASAGEFDFIEVSTRIYCDGISKADLAAVFIARNATVFELGEEFHLLLDRENKGAMQDLHDRVVTSGRPYALYQPGEKTGPKVATVPLGVVIKKGNNAHR